jgi:hypothetical protein
VKIVKGVPPVFEKAREVFGDQVQGAIFCWGEEIYNPSGIDISSHLIAHEIVHSGQQSLFKGGVEAWWEDYLKDQSFRLSQELPAHKVEYEHFCKTAKSRNERRLYLKAIAKRLSSSLYGNLVTFDKAKSLIKGKSDVSD